jgi:hypothetical protein
VKHHALLLRAFPRAWRELYGTQVLSLLAEDPSGRWQGFDLVRAGVAERWHAATASAAGCRRDRCRGPALGLRRGHLGLVGSVAVPLILAIVIATSAVVHDGAPGGRHTAATPVGYAIPLRAMNGSPVQVPGSGTAVRSVVVRLPHDRLTSAAAGDLAGASAVRVRFLSALRHHQDRADGSHLPRFHPGRAAGLPTFAVVSVLSVSSVS